jgi:hypothetical protein
MSRARTVACISISYLSKLVATAVVILAVGEAVNLADLWIEARKDG